MERLKKPRKISVIETNIRAQVPAGYFVNMKPEHYHYMEVSGRLYYIHVNYLKHSGNYKYQPL